MGTKAKTFLLLGVVAFLLGTTLYVSYLLRSEAESSPTTVKKTKAAQQTYSKTLDIPATPTNTPTPTASPLTPTVTPTPTSSPLTPTVVPSSSIRAIGGATTPSPTLGTTATPTPTPTTAVLALNTTISPTETVLVSTTPTTLASSSATPTKAAALPTVGWMKPMHLLFIFAFSMIFFSLLY